MDALEGGAVSHERDTPVDVLCKDTDDRVDATRDLIRETEGFHPGNRLFLNFLATDSDTQMLQYYLSDVSLQ